MARFRIKPVVAVAAVGFLGGCATSMDLGPGYYRYDTHIAGSEPRVVTTEHATVYQEPVAVYHDNTYVAPATASAPPATLVPQVAAPPSGAPPVTDTTPSATYTPGATVVAPGPTVYQERITTYRDPVVVYRDVYRAPDRVLNLSPSYTDRARGQ
jgi:hypothetical protein